MQKNQQQVETKEDKLKMNIGRFVLLGGTAAIIGLFATAPQFAENAMAQEIGLYSCLIAALGIGGALWSFTTLEDMRSGYTVANELRDIKAGFKSVFARVRKEFDDEFATNQGLENIQPEVVPAKRKTSIK